MKIESTSLDDVKLLHPTVFGDERGFFYESFNHQRFEALIGRSVTFVQDNHSRSSRGVLRGLHYQVPPYAQAKLVRVVRGTVFDVAVDVRCDSPTFGQWFGAELSEENKCQLWIPEGFAHAFMVLSDSADFVYKTTDYWHKDAERAIAWDDAQIGIDWPAGQTPQVSPKDAAGWSLARVREAREC